MIARLRLGRLPTVTVPFVALFLVVLLSLVPAAAVAATVAADCRVSSLPEIEDEVMCPICGVPLVNAGGKQAENERDFIRDLVDQCESKQAIKTALVDEYGEQVLAVPSSDGFGLAAYLVPIVGIALAAFALALGAMRWRRGPGSSDDEHDGDSPADDDNQSDAGPDLAADLRRYDL